MDELIKNLIKSRLTNEKYILSKADLEIVSSLQIGSSNTDEKVMEIAYLLCNSENNLDRVIKKNISKLLSFSNGDVDYSDIESVPIYGRIISELKTKSKKINGRTLRPQQEIVYELSKKYNICLSAPTGFGKTFIFINLITEIKESGKKCLFLVPSDLLEEQLIYKLKMEKPQISHKIGSDFNSCEIIISTPENAFPWIEEYKNEITHIVVDEAHTLFYKNDARAIFALELVKKMADITAARFFFISPKMNRESNLEFIKEKTGNEMVEITISSNKPQRIVGLHDGSIFSSAENIVIKNNHISLNKPLNGLTLYYTNQVNDVVDLAFHISSTSEARIRFERIIKNKNSNDVKFFFDKVKELNKYSNKYIGQSSINQGVCYFHSNMPNEVKNSLLDLISRGFIHSVVSTHAIINGVDLPFDNLVVKSVKMFNREMRAIDFINLIGRVGRNCGEKRTTNMGLVLLDSSSEPYGNKNEKSVRAQSAANSTWWLKNKESLKNLNEDFVSDNDDPQFTLDSLERYKVTGNDDYLIDIRVNPIIVDVIKEKYSKEMVDQINMVVFSKINRKNKKEFLSLIKDLILDYGLLKYTGTKRLFGNWESDEQQAAEIIFNFFLRNMNVDSIAVHKARSLIWKNNEINAIELTTKVEEEIKKAKIIAKHLFMIFLNHINSLIGTEKTAHARDILSYKLISKDVIEWLKNNDLHEEWMINVSDKNISYKALIEKIDGIEKFKEIFNNSSKRISGKTEIRRFFSDSFLKKIEEKILVNI